MIRNSVLLELRDLADDTLDAADGRVVLAWEWANEDEFVVADWGGLELELSIGGTGGSAL